MSLSMHFLLTSFLLLHMSMLLLLFQPMASPRWQSLDSEIYLAFGNPNVSIFHIRLGIMVSDWYHGYEYEQRSGGVSKLLASKS
jgi:hypothetical protein